MEKGKHKPRFILGFECIAQKYSANAGYVFGKIYNLELNGSYNEFRGSVSWLAARVGLSYNATFKIVKQLETDDLIVDTTPENLKNNKTQVRYYITNPYKLLELSLGLPNNLRNSFSSEFLRSLLISFCLYNASFSNLDK